MGTKEGLPAMLWPRKLMRGLGMPPPSHSSTGSKAWLAARGWCRRPRLKTRPSMVVTVVWEAPADTHTWSWEKCGGDGGWGGGGQGKGCTLSERRSYMLCPE
jgi:hypothetical protein